MCGRAQHGRTHGLAQHAQATQCPCVVHLGPRGARLSLGPVWTEHAVHTRFRMFFMHPTVQIAADHDRTIEINSEFDQIISSSDVHDWMVLVQAGHDRTAMDDFKLD